MIPQTKRNLIVGFVLFLVLGAAVAFMRLQKMEAQIQQASSVKNLGDLQAAIAIYYGDHKGDWPSSLDALVPKYLKSIPEDGATRNNKVVPTYDGSGGWVYDKQTGDIQPNRPGFVPAKKNIKPQ